MVVETGQEYIADESYIRYGRLSCLIVQEGTRSIQNFIHSNLPIHTSLSEAIFNNENVFRSLEKKGILNQSQCDILFSNPDGSICEENIDISLWIIIGTTIIPEISIDNWKKVPLDFEIQPGHDLLRIRNVRNSLANLSFPDLTTDMYNRYWRIVSSALGRLGSTTQNINNIQNTELDPKITQKCVLEVSRQSYQDLFNLYIQENKNRTFVKRAVILIGIIAIVLVLVIVLPIVLILRPRTPCKHFIQTLYTNDNLLKYMPRSGWNALPAQGPEDPVASPADYLIVSDTAMVGRCYVTEDCCRNMQLVQNFNIKRSGYSDIAYSYIIGDDGVIYEGRGLNAAPATAKGFNKDSISMAFMGSYFSGLPTTEAMNAAYGFLAYILDKDIVRSNFTIYALCQVRGEKFPYSPGPEIYKEMQHWGNGTWGWRPRNGSHCLGPKNGHELYKHVI